MDDKEKKSLNTGLNGLYHQNSPKTLGELQNMYGLPGTISSLEKLKSSFDFLGGIGHYGHEDSATAFRDSELRKKYLGLTFDELNKPMNSALNEAKPTRNNGDSQGDNKKEAK
ncbi:hypothetical protein [Mucilaginibacter myungsuensis]|uniref:Uncharacterized protein n=1 Tax=Mucilaginibacter myungsuensis TaxID=649104 RepID=A0A929KYW9_9SPHI|nr:hypothetical protein [Mucilaginibacter myungsuensis]MBE9662483.1 hypothetical protein [Mucilaginibacter myungsuensis]MDN3597902.1 hypothetical protein [Mucilaginibacter myungsuensis]